MTTKKISKKGGVGIVLVVLIIIIAIVIGLFGLRTIGATSGSHSGYVTAVEHNSNIIYAADLVYFKTDAQSSQEDIYCVNDADVKAQLMNYSEKGTRVTVFFQNDFIMWAWQCNGGESIIYKVEVYNG